MWATTREVAVPPSVQRDAKTTSSPFHSPANAARRVCSGSGDDAARWSWVMASASLDGLHDLLRGVVEIVGRHHVQAGFTDDLLAQLDIGAFEANHQRHAEADFTDGGGDALGDHVALHDATEDVDQNALHVGIRSDDLEGGRDLFLAGAAADVEEVRRRHAVELDDVHRRHREAGAVDHAADIAVEGDVVEVVFRRLDFLGVFLGLVAQREHLGVTEQGVVVERHLGVEHAELALLGHDQRVDLQHRHVLGDERRVELRGELLGLLGEIAGQFQRVRDGAAVMRHDAGGGIDRETHDLFGGVVRDILDIDAAFGGDHERHFGGFAIDQDREIELLLDVGAFLDVEPVDLLALRAGLHRDQGRAQHLPGELVDLGDRFGDPDAALVAGGSFVEFALAAAAGVDLALHHPDRSAKLFGGGIRFRRLQHGDTLGNRHAELVQQRLGLVFMDIHLDAPRTSCGEVANSRPIELAYHMPAKPQLRNSSAECGDVVSRSAAEQVGRDLPAGLDQPL